jgi:hypothetical protein
MDRAFGRLGGDALFLGDRHALDEFTQAFEGFVSVLFLASMLLGLDDDDAVLGDALVFECEQFIFVLKHQLNI